MSGATTPTAAECATLDERDLEPRTPMKRLGSTRKLAAFSNIRAQLSEQARVLEARAEAAAGVAAELADHCRRRADLELDYSRALDKLARAASQRHKDHKHKREQWPLTGAFTCWQAALEQTRALARDHAALGELYGGPLAARLQRAAEDVARLQRRGRELLAERQEELGAALAEAAAAGKTHAGAAAAWRAAALKLRAAHLQRRAAPAPPDAPRTRKLKALDKELQKRRARHSAARAAALRARADYVLSLEAANATLQRYYLDDVADVMLCTEVGYEAVVGRAVRTAGAAENARARSLGAAAGALLAAADSLDALAARRRLLEAHRTAFAPPAPLAPRPPPPADLERDMRALLPDEEETDEAAEEVTRELHARLAQLEAAARTLRAECREHAKTLDAAEAELVRMMEGSAAQWEVGSLLAPAATAPTPPAAAAAPTASAAPTAPTVAASAEDDAPRRAQEDYYLALVTRFICRGDDHLVEFLERTLIFGGICVWQKFRAYVCSAGRLARLEGKAAAMRARLLPAAPTAPTFLAHLAEHSEHNMMDAWNLAICLGPTLLAAWGEGGAQVTAQNLVNELVKRIILHHKELFPQDVAPHTLYRRPGEEDDELTGEGAGEGAGVGVGEGEAEGAAGEGGDEADAAARTDDEHDLNDDLSLYDDEDDLEEEEEDDDEDASDEPDAASTGAPASAVSGVASGAAQDVERRRLAESTPDLVLDLPARAAADTFLCNRDTLRKRPAPPAAPPAPPAPPHR
ncbi:PREDICTED: SLIT-ROBO Rho GTPase-activating protein 2-like [Papilio xuthus]|uniref:SLIT-ROBO Rho GTPase-activating protein 2-like n=1 Tax=Papilio xuthus TaxID=66420 RepID=A0AAJ6YZA8_PAPXU|nr:PREDICTED: SLIT-ROBO Rho GTPase-activating protein 2-like [Papilio xuthus]